MVPIAKKKRWPRIALGIGVIAVVALLGTTKALPHLFPQVLRPLWGKLGAPNGRDVSPALADLPVVYYDGHDATGPVAILLSGNGGWWGLCDQLATRLQDEHVSTIGLNSLAYFVAHRTPTTIAADIERMASTVDPQRPIMLLGYSYGADVVATIYNDLDPALRSRIQFVSMMGLTRYVNYGIGFWQVAAETRKTAPAVARISGPAIQCFAGDEEGRLSACHALDPRQVEIIEMPGGHHFGGDYEALAQHVIDSWKRRVVVHVAPASTAPANMPAPTHG